MADESTYFGEAVIWQEDRKSLSAEQVTIASGEDLTSRNILGKISFTVPTTGTADGGNTGNGTVTSVTGDKGTQVGAYTITCSEAKENGGVFVIRDPYGNVIDTVELTEGAVTVPTTGTADGGNTGNGTVTSVTGDAGTQVGSYVIECTVAASGGGTFTVTDPNGNIIDTVEITPGAFTVPTTGTADGGNTGNGTVTSVADGGSVKVGTYTFVCVAAATNGGTFELENPDGDTIAVEAITGGAGGTATFATSELDATVTDGGTDFAVGDKFTVAVTQADGGTATIANNELNATITDGSTDFAEGDFFTVAVTQADGGTATIANNELNGTITDGATDFVQGDFFTVTVAAGSGKCVELDTTATDGSQNFYGILVDDTDASSADVEATAIVRDALIIADNLDWPTGISAANKAIALAEMKDMGILERTEVS